MFILHVFQHTEERDEFRFKEKAIAIEDSRTESLMFY